MDWQIQAHARASSLTGKPFEPGDPLICFLIRSEAGDGFERVDLLAEEEAHYNLPADGHFGRWTRVMKAPEQEKADARAAIAGSEELFLSLYEPEAAQASEEVAVLKHLLALLLERKRILKPEGPRVTEGIQVYRHPKSDQRFDVPVVPLDAAFVDQARAHLDDLLI
ncbi:MAG: hypothetical protein ACFE0O_13440 [Opitutales bacterium]